MKRGKMFAIFLGAALLMAALPFAGQAALYAPLPQQPRIVDTLSPTADVVVADLVVTEAPYLADNSGAADSTQAIRTALADCYNAGGGTVYLPAGKYRVTDAIKIPAFVTLRGDWQSPDEGTDYGTVILADVPSVDAANPALFTIGGSAAAMGLTVFYPNQSIENPKPYPFTFYISGNGGEDYMLQSVIDCTVINGYRGIGVCVDELGAHEMMSLENVKGCFLSVGAVAYNQADVGTWKGLSIDNKYWANAAAEYAVTDAAALDAYTRANAVGMILGDLEWTEFADINISGRSIGIHIAKGKRIEFAGSMFDVNVTNCKIGLQVDSIDDRWGMAVARGSISGSEAAIVNTSKGYVKIADVHVQGKQSGKIVKSEADLSALNVPYDSAPVKCAARLFVVSADNNRESDISAVLQQRIDDAAAAGGGVVYLPAGKYLLSQPVTVPAGVELRGIGAAPTREQSGSSRGTLIFADYGRSDQPDTAQALITLAGENAGIRNLRFVYDGNRYSHGPQSYGYTLRGTAKGVYAINVCMVASDHGIDFRGCDNHLIKKLVGVWYSNMMALGGKNGVVEGCLYNPNNYFRNGYEVENWPPEGAAFTDLINPITRVRTEAIRVAESENQLIFNTFAYGVKTLLVNNGGKNVQLINLGSDNIGANTPQIKTSGGSMTGVNLMRYNGVSLENNGTDLKLYNRISILVPYEPTVDGSFTSRLQNFFAPVLNLLHPAIRWLSEAWEWILGLFR